MHSAPATGSSAVDTTSQFPAQALKEKKSVGYMRALSSEGVISVGASMVLASERSGPPEVVKTLKATSVPYVESAVGGGWQGRVLGRTFAARLDISAPMPTYL